MSKCLLVEDLALPQSWEVQFIKSAVGCEVDLANNYHESIAKLRKEKYDLIIADYYLGTEGTGADVCKYAKDLHPDTATVILSGRVCNENWDYVDLYLNKGWPIETLKMGLKCL
jgi:CheY-like chemotaxis protein